MGSGRVGLSVGCGEPNRLLGESSEYCTDNSWLGQYTNEPIPLIRSETKMSNGPVRIWGGWHENRNPKDDQWTPRRLPTYAEVAKFLPPRRSAANTNYVQNEPSDDSPKIISPKKRNNVVGNRRTTHFRISKKSRQIIIEESNNPSSTPRAKESIHGAKPQAKPIPGDPGLRMLIALKMAFSMHPNQLKKRIGESFQTIDSWIANPKSISQSDLLKIEKLFREVLP